MAKTKYPARLIAHIENSYATVTKEFPDAIGTAKFTFDDKSICNVFETGSVTFQGKASTIKGEIEAQIVIIDRG
ncbi:hypothetical protein F0170_16740 [Pseudomonas sp. MAFF 730085]|uniref:Uncharacterized protein n=1 Tax=Pseudomonas kitaguniensis TaxID=2607908 RepID=A0A5N7JVS8_9PSED|nr:hypothetical protein [Pseudomonas kitaguniensis]MPQ85494.1 hypothetical protein [Pseudomonas kitaguniensis]